MLKHLGFLIKIVKREGHDEGFGDDEMSLSNFTKYSIHSPILNARQEYNMLCVNSFTKNRARMSFIVQDCSRSNEYMLVVKGEDISFKGCFNLNKMGNKEFNQYKSMLSDYKVQGLKRIVVATKVLTQEEVEDYLTTYNIICESSREQLEAFESHVMKIETDLTFVGCIGIQQIIRDDALKLLADLKVAKVQCNILSGDSLDNCLNVAKELGMTTASFNDTSTYRFLKFKTEQQGLMDMRRLLDNIYEKIVDQNLETVDYLLGKEREERTSSKKHSQAYPGLNIGMAKDEPEEKSKAETGIKKTLIISGNAMPVIISSPQLRDYFKTILLFSNTVIGFSMQPSHKACVVRVMKEVGQRVLAIGDGLNDLAMFNEANVSIQLCNKDVQMSLADIEVGDLNIVRTLIFCLGAKINRNIIFGSILFFWFTLNWSLIEIYFFATNLFSKSLFTTFQAVSIIVIISAVFVGFQFFDDPYSNEFLLTYPKAFLERQIVRYHLPKIIIVVIGVAMLECFLLFYVNAVFVANMHTSSGNTFTNSFVSFLVMISVMIANISRVYFAMSRKTIYHHVVFFVVICASVGYSFSQLREQYVTELDVLKIGMLFENPMVWGFFSYFIATSAFCSWIIITFVKNMYFSPLSRIIGKNLKVRRLDYFKSGFSSNISKAFKQLIPRSLPLGLIGTIKNCFNKVTVKDPTVQKLLSIDYLNYSWPIDWLNRLKDISERRKFKRVKHQKETTYWRRYLIVSISFGLLVYLVNLLVGDFRGNYNLDSADLYFVFICSMLLCLTFTNISNRGLLRAKNYLFTLLDMVYIGLLFATRTLPWHPFNILIGKFLMAPINSEFLFCSALSLSIDLCFLIS